MPCCCSTGRMAVRDGSPADPAGPANRRYVGGQRRYLRECDPASRATVVDNADLAAPFVVDPGQVRGA